MWPLSRESRPKQLLPLSGELTLVQQTVLRVADPAAFAPPLVIAGADHRFAIAEQIRAVGVDGARVLLEPVGRSTAPAAAAAALTLAAEHDPDALMLLMPADHLIADVEAFLAAVELGAVAASQGALVLFGVRPDSPATGYGYIRTGEAMTEAPGVNAVAAFVEKPDAERAAAYVAGGEHLWNSGIFLFSAGALIAATERHAPDVLTSARAAVEGAATDLDFVRLAPDAFAASPSISIDHAVMERTERAAVVPVDMGWCDLGAWSTLWACGAKDADGNVVAGDVMSVGARASYLRSEGPLIAAVGVENLIVVATTDAVLVADRTRDQDVKAVVDRLKAGGRTLATQSPKVHRPWGSYETIALGPTYQVKRIEVLPGRRLSLQKHGRRAEHWTVVEGEATVEVDGLRRMLGPNQSVEIPLGAVHRLTNAGTDPLVLVEVQCGDYLGEDDIVRLEDDFRRT